MGNSFVYAYIRNNINYNDRYNKINNEKFSINDNPKPSNCDKNIKHDNLEKIQPT